MTTIEAYHYVLELLEDLRSSGIKVHIKPSRSASSREMVEKYRDTPSIPPNLWRHVEITVKDREQQETVFLSLKSLLWKGICFDTGGIGDRRDWELDWSLRVSETPCSFAEDAVDIVEEMIADLLDEAS